MVSFYSVIRKSINTSKSGFLVKMNKVVLAVEKKSSKRKIKAAIKLIFGVNVKKINVINTSRKTKKIGRSIGKTKCIKKAILSLYNKEDTNALLDTNKRV